ncbi:virion structural protein [Myxococcus phage Mx8]|uniref:Virion structural protein n=1 Tax=Myxococcus phage Mx8 TaxID=49964 RepID=Q94MR2_9CAUD|nr:virion structural protein [Myxococcus phage Mx8]AAK94392.1 virion structural protein [Myxococcus phage Mx8]
MAQTPELPPVDVEWEDGTTGLDMPPPDVEWDASSVVVQPQEAPAAGPEVVPEPSPTARRQIGRTRAGALGFAQGGTLGFADEIGGLIGRTFVPESSVRLGEAARPLATDTPEERAAKVEARASQLNPSSYELVRDAVRNEADEAREQQPGAFITGQVLGGLATAPVTPGAGAASLGQLVRTGAVMGAASGLGDSNADLSRGEYDRAILDTALGGATGAAGGAVGYGVGQAAPVVARVLQRALRNTAQSTGRRVLTSGADQLSKRAELPAEVVQEALDTGAIVPWGTTAGAFKRLESAAADTGDVYGAIVEDLAKEGVVGPNARGLMDELLAEAKKLDLTEMNPALPQEYRTVANKLSDMSELAEARGLAPTNRFALSQIEDIKRSLQDKAQYGRYEETPLNKVRKGIAATVRRHTEDAIAEQSARSTNPNVQQAAEAFEPVKQRLSRLIGAREAARRGTAREAQRIGGASGPSAFDVANAATATGSTGAPAMLAAMAGRVWKERGPSTIASVSDALSTGFGGLGRYLAASPGRARGGSLLGGAVERSLAPQALDQYVAPLFPTEEEERRLRQKALAEALGRAP